MSQFDKKKKKGGIFAPLLNMLGGGTSTIGGAGSGLGGLGSGAGGLSGLFATKAGILGMVLGAATIAAGVGVVYNFLGPSARQPAYGPHLFQDTYYAEQVSNAGLERARQKETDPSAASTLDLFRAQAKKDGLGVAGEGGAAGGRGGAAPEPAAAPASGDNPSAEPPAAGSPSGVSATSAKLQSVPGFGAKPGGLGSLANMPKLSGGGGMFNGIGAKFAPIYRPPAGQQQGKALVMKRSLASIVKGSPKYAVPGATKKGSYGQAKFAGKLGARAAYSAPGGADSRTTAAEAFVGETAGTGDVGAEGGTGLGGAGLSGNQLKSSDPSMNQSAYTPPEPGKPADVSPWKKMQNIALAGMIAGALLLALANMLMKKAKALAATGPAGIAQAIAMYKMAMMVAVAAMGAGGVVIFAGMTIWKKYGQKWTGIAYAAAGGAIIVKAIQVMSAASDGIKSAESVHTEVVDKGITDANGSSDFNMSQLSSGQSLGKDEAKTK
jgi:hypothetical protein